MKRPTENLNPIIRGADSLSLGISMVVAVAIGVICGYYSAKWTGVRGFFYFFLIIGVAAAFLNVYKFYKMQQKELKELENNPKYAKYAEVIKKQEIERQEMLRKMDGEYSEFDDKFGKDEWDKEDEKWM
ncbi:MAG: AtpZ/AtpI family protein [Campylobacter sp.]|nr:AtpZ/AtpI family protein [Campylobacter sp.]